MFGREKYCSRRLKRRTLRTELEFLSEKEKGTFREEAEHGSRGGVLEAWPRVTDGLVEGLQKSGRIEMEDR